MKNMSRLVSPQYSKRNSQIFICRMCLNPFRLTNTCKFVVKIRSVMSRFPRRILELAVLVESKKYNN